MPRTLITARYALDWKSHVPTVLTMQAGDGGNENEFVWRGGELLVAYNPTGGALAFDVVDIPSGRGRDMTPSVPTVAANGGVVVVGPLPSEGFVGSGDGAGTIGVDINAGLEFAILDLRSGMGPPQAARPYTATAKQDIVEVSTPKWPGDGVALSFTASDTGGNELPFKGRQLGFWRNDDAGAQLGGMNVSGRLDSLLGRDTPFATTSIPSDALAVHGPFVADGWADGNGALLPISASTNVEIAFLNVGRFYL